MNNPQDTTIKTYRDNFDKYTERTVSKVGGEFQKWIGEFTYLIPDGGKILEIGSAVGRDARYFKSQGYEVLCTDIIPEALEKLSREEFETSEFDFRNDPKKEWEGQFDGVFANAVLLHAQQEVFENFLLKINVVLKNDGAFAFSVKNGEGEEISEEKMDAPRYFKYYTKDELADILAKYPYEIISLSYADNEKWLHAILKKK